MNATNQDAMTLEQTEQAAYNQRKQGEAKRNPFDALTDLDQYRAFEMGWHRDGTQEDYLEIVTEMERLEMAHAMGQDLPQDPNKLAVMDELVADCAWTWDVDSGRVVSKADQISA